MPSDKSNDDEETAEHFSTCEMRASARDGAGMGQLSSRGASILDLECRHGAISRVLIEEGFDVYVADASAKLIAAFRERVASKWNA